MSFQRYLNLFWSDNPFEQVELNKLRRLFPDECYDWQWMFFHGMDPDKGYYPGIAHAYEKRRWQVLEGDERRSWEKQAKDMRLAFDLATLMFHTRNIADAENIYFDNHERGKHAIRKG